MLELHVKHPEAPRIIIRVHWPTGKVALCRQRQNNNDDTTEGEPL